MLVIYFIAHSEWILQRSRADMARNLKSDFKIISICPVSEYKANLEDSDKMLHSGRDIICSGYCLYGGSTQLVYARDDMEGIQMETFIVSNWMKNLTNQLAGQSKVYFF